MRSLRGKGKSVDTMSPDGIKKLSNGQAKWLTYLVWVLITLMSGSILAQFNLIREQNVRITQVEESVTRIKDAYTPLERHRSDFSQVCASLNRIDAKLDRLIESQLKSKLY